MLDWTEQFSGIASLDDRLRNRLRMRAQIRKFPAGTVLFGPDKPPSHMLLLLEGTVRVHKQSETGREIVLYRVNAGDSCVMTSACLLAYEGGINAEGVAETDIRAVAIPRSEFDDLMADSRDFRNFVFSAYAKRISDLFYIIDEIAFRRLDIRLAQKLLELAGSTDAVRATHQTLAAELGTAREVVTRQLQEFQRRDWVRLSRGVIDLLDRTALQDLVDNA